MANYIPKTIENKVCCLQNKISSIHCLTNRLSAVENKKLDLPWSSHQGISLDTLFVSVTMAHAS